MRQWSAIVLAGGRGARLGGVEKSDLMIGDQTLLEHVVAGLEVPTVVVGPERRVSREVRFVLEQPRYGGPVAGLRAAIDLIDTPVVSVLAVDLPHAVGVLHTLVERFEVGMEVLVPVRDGHDEYVCSVFATEALRRGLAVCGDSMRYLFAQLQVSRFEIAGDQSALLDDIDTAEDLKRLQRNPGR